MKEYRFITPSLFSGITAREAASELERIKSKYGILKPETVVKESKDEGAVLHGYFNWDDESAAELYRAQQASDLIRNIRVVITEQKSEYCVRAFVNVRSEGNNTRSYVPLPEALADEEAYKDLLSQAKAEMSSFVSKYSQLEELNNVKAEMLKVLL